MFLVILLFIDMLKIHPLKNFKYKYLFGDIILATNVASSNNYSSIDIHTNDIGEFECMIVDPTMAIENIEIAKKRNIYINSIGISKIIGE